MTSGLGFPVTVGAGRRLRGDPRVVEAALELRLKRGQLREGAELEAAGGLASSARLAAAVSGGEGVRPGRAELARRAGA
eukprot:4458155-Pyramimonas_sp.AAC.1